MSRIWCIAVALCLLAAPSAIQAQDVFVLPGSASSNTNVIVASAASLSSLGTFNAGAGAFQVLAKPDGTKFYVISNSGVVTVVNSAFTNAQQIAALPQPPTAAVITPDGRRLLVTAGRLYIFDTATDTAVVSGGVDVGSNALDVAVSMDGSKAFVIGTQPNQFGLLTSVDLTTNTSLSQVVLPGLLTGVSVGPNGFLYVTGLNYFQELYANTLSSTPMGNIPVNGRPGKLGFTPDGRFALAGDLRSGVAVFQFDLSNHVLVNSIPAFGVVIDKILVAGNGLAYAYSSQTQNLYPITITPTHLSLGTLVIPGVNASQVSSVALSDDLAVGDRTLVQSLYLVSNGTLFRVDPASNAQTGQFPVGSTGGALSFAGAASAGPPANLYAYNIAQTIQPGTVSAPIVVRVLDAGGRPVMGAVVTFTPDSSGATVQNTTVTTGFDGYAATLVTAPSTTGSGVVSATVGGLTQNFSFLFGTPTPGGGGAGEALSIVSGQGQILFAQITSGGAIASAPMVVLLKDSTGAPLPNSPVTFTITQGTGSLSGGGLSGNSIVITTDSNGMASVVYVNTDVQPGTGFAQAGVQATAGGASATFFVTIPFDHPAFVQFLKPQNGQALSGASGSTLKGAVTAVVVSSQGIPIPNVSLHLDNDPLSQNPVNQDSSGNALPQEQHNPHVGPTANSATVECAGGFALSDAKGQISCDVVFGSTLGFSRFTANAGYFANSPLISFTVTAGPPSQLILVSGNTQSGSGGQTLPMPLVVRVTDAGGNALANVGVVYQVISGSGTLSNVTATDANGYSQATLTLGSTAGPGQVKVSVGSISKTFTFLVTVPVSGLNIVSGDAQSTQVNTAFGQPLVVKVTDGQGNAVVGAQVAFAVTSGNATVGTPLATTIAGGLASTTVQAGPNAGPITVQASTNGIIRTFTLSAVAPGPTGIVFLNAGSFQPGLSPGALIVITGTGIATGISGVVVPTVIVGPHPTQLAGVSVAFNGILSPIFSVSNVNGVEQVTVQVPFEISPGPTTVTINAANGTSTTLNNVQVAPYSPGIFATTNFGPPQAVVLRSNGYVTPSNPAHQGDIVKMFVTGMGQVSPPTSTNVAGTGNQSIVARFDIGVNDMGVQVISSEYAPGLIGVYIITFKIPDDAATGPNRPLAVIAYDANNKSYPGGGFGIPIAPK
ncbi:MAG: hypothetical protein M3O35_10060 [Acidobacteriota bacterium]|nr:hypothetical protein [Acidobacteriota bacterium]